MLNIHNTSFWGSAAKMNQYPNTQLPEVAMVGRSNVGKSSLINKTLGRKSIARVSGQPGKTATLNFYNVDNSLFLVDLPGYGYAKVSKSEQAAYRRIIEEYLTQREELKAIIQLVDLRHPPSVEDTRMMGMIKDMGYYPIVVATKSDKLSKKGAMESLEVIKNALELSEDDVLFPFSSVTGEGRDNMLLIIEEIARTE